MRVRLPLGDAETTVDLDPYDATVLEPAGGTPVDVREAATRAVTAPQGPPLHELASPGDTVAVVVTDVTRATPDDVLLDVLMGELTAGGVDPGAVTVVVGLGLHRPMTEAELEAGLGRHADRAINHDPEAAVAVGRVDGTPIEVHPAVADADLVVSTGMVEPHQYAGFSGGAKTVVIGAGGEPLIRYTHGPGMLAREGVRLGRVDGNPFRETLDRAGEVVGHEFALNVTKGPAGVLGASAGDPRAVVWELAGTAREALSVPVAEEYDAVLAGVGAPKDANLYQTTRAATYVILGDRNPLRAGGRVVIPAALPEGAGEGSGERRFYEWLSGADSATALYEAMRDGYEPGAQRAFVVARALRNHDVYITDSQAPSIVEECLMCARDSVAAALKPGDRVLVVPDALDTLLVAPE